MEVSQQQRRSETGRAISQFASALSDAKLAYDALDLIDALWLAQFYEPGIPTRRQSAVSDENSQLDNPKLMEAVADEPAYDLYVPERQSPVDDASQTSEEVSDATDDFKGMPFPVPAAPSLRRQLPLARALRPLMRKVPSRQRFDIDEAATVTQIAETMVWMPVVRPRPERWLDLDIVIEDSKTTAIWSNSITELIHLAEYQGAFRAVRTWRLSSDRSGNVQLYSRWQSGKTEAGAEEQQVVGQRSRSPRELVDPTGRRLIWLISDCISELWRSPAIYQVLSDWSQQQSVSIVQMFPERLWSRTALRDGYVVVLGAMLSGSTSAKLSVSGLPKRLQKRNGEKLATVPVLTLEPEILQRWAKVVAGVGDLRTVGRTFDIRAIEKWKDRSSSHREHRIQTSERTAAERVALFRATASPTVRQLANLMAAVPVSLPVIDLLREEFKEWFTEPVTQAHVAEVLLSGLLRRADTHEDDICRYTFVGDGLAEPSHRVRDILISAAPIKTTRQVLDVLSKAICDKLGLPARGFEALLLNSDAVPKELQTAALPFASVGLDVLRRLGGEHAELARKVDLKRWGSGTEQGLPEEFPPLEMFAFEFVQFQTEVNFPPPLTTEEFTVYSLTRRSRQEESTRQPLEPFSITVATLVEVDGQWQVHRTPAQARRFVEHLPEDIALEMVAIPGGSFLMGSPEDESGRYDNESPQHEVTVAPFFMGRYPVTQVQWRLVAAMPQIERSLDLDPSHFKGDELLPVEQVSWYDAVEFCARLSAHTGREYRLPTEAEWEYACRAETTTAFHFGDTMTTELANYGGSAYADGPQGEGRGHTTPVNHFGIANTYGLSDMHGNVYEWCQDHWHSDYEGAPTDGSAWLTNNKNVGCLRRGGSWFYGPRYCRSAYRFSLDPGYRFDLLGFRVSCAAPSTLWSPCLQG